MRNKVIIELTNKILDQADVTSSILEASYTLRDKDITSVDDVQELALYIINDGNLFRSRTQNIITNLKKKAAKGNYDRELAVKAFMYVVDDGVRKYDKEYGSGGGALFLPKATRMEIARELRNHYEEQVLEDVPEDVNESTESFEDQVDAWAKEDFDKVLDKVYLGKCIEVTGKIGGDLITYRYYRDGSKTER